MKDSPLRQQIAYAIHRNRFPDSTWDRQPAVIQADYLNCADAILAAILPHDESLGDALRHAECQLVATQAALGEVLATFDGIRNSDGTGDIQHWQARATPGEYRRWQAALRPDAAEEPMFGAPGCTCRPFTRQTDPPRYLDQPGDTVDQISGWTPGADCPHHEPRPADELTPAEEGRLDRAHWTAKYDR